MTYSVFLPAVFTVLFTAFAVSAAILAGAAWLYDYEGLRWMRFGALFMFGSVVVICLAFVGYFIGGWIFDYQSVRPS